MRRKYFSKNSIHDLAVKKHTECGIQAGFVCWEVI